MNAIQREIMITIRGVECLKYTLSYVKLFGSFGWSVWLSCTWLPADGVCISKGQILHIWEYQLGVLLLTIFVI